MGLRKANFSLNKESQTGEPTCICNKNMHVYIHKAFSGLFTSVRLQFPSKVD